jgi:hypothetical protein
MRSSRAPTAAELQSPPPPQSSTKSGRFFGKANLGENPKITDVDDSVLQYYSHVERNENEYGTPGSYNTLLPRRYSKTDLAHSSEPQPQPAAVLENYVTDVKSKENVPSTGWTGSAKSLWSRASSFDRAKPGVNPPRRLMSKRSVKKTCLKPAIPRQPIFHLKR